MSDSYIGLELRRHVTSRAARRCEYCLIHEEDTFIGCQIDHVISEKHGGLTNANNLALACVFCNRYKGSDIATLDEIGNLTALFNPRTQLWHEHFQFVGLHILGTTSIGRSTSRLLRFNDYERLEERRLQVKPAG